MVEGAFDRGVQTRGINSSIFHDLRHNCMTRWAREDVAASGSDASHGLVVCAATSRTTRTCETKTWVMLLERRRGVSSLVLPNGKQARKKGEQVIEN